MVDIPIFAIAYKDFKLKYMQLLSDYNLICDGDKQVVWVCHYIEGVIR